MKAVHGVHIAAAMCSMFCFLAARYVWITIACCDNCSLLAGIGFSTQGVSLNRLPGWEPHSYGYHGDDGMAFESCGTGKPYGPVFATGEFLYHGCILKVMFPCQSDISGWSPRAMSVLCSHHMMAT